MKIVFLVQFGRDCIFVESFCVVVVNLRYSQQKRSRDSRAPPRKVLCVDENFCFNENFFCGFVKTVFSLRIILCFGCKLGKFSIKMLAGVPGTTLKGIVF